MLNSNLKKLVVVFTLLVVIFGFVSSYLFIQVYDLENQVYDLAKQTEDLQNQNSVLEGQVLENQNQTNQLENQISELQQDKIALQENVSELENQLQKYNTDMLQEFIKENTNKINITQFYISRFTSQPPAIHSIWLAMTIHNQGVNHIKNLMIFIDFTTYEESSLNRTIDIIHSGEILTLIFKTAAWAGTRFYETNIVATLYANDLLLDEVTLIKPLL